MDFHISVQKCYTHSRPFTPLEKTIGKRKKQSCFHVSGYSQYRNIMTCCQTQLTATANVNLDVESHQSPAGAYKRTHLYTQRDLSWVMARFKAKSKPNPPETCADKGERNSEKEIQRNKFWASFFSPCLWIQCVFPYLKMHMLRSSFRGRFKKFSNVLTA